jgi:5-methylcytosine-specific restriction endonuclease McrA
MADDNTNTCLKCSVILADPRSKHCPICKPEVNREYKRLWTAAYRESNPEKVKAYAAAYRERNNELSRKRYASNPLYREKDAQYSRENRERMREHSRNYLKRNREMLAAKKREYRKAHPEKTRNYYLANREKILAYDKARSVERTAREAIRRATMAGVSAGDRAAISEYYKTIRTARSIKCYWCKCNVPKSERQVDHIVPLAKGGEHSLINLCCACAHCNVTKGAKHPNEFADQLLLLAVK